MAKATGLTIDIGANVADFNKGMRSMTRETRKTKRDVSVLAQSLEMEFDASTFEKAQQQAQKAIEQTDERAETLRDRLEHLEETGQMDTAHYEDVQRELNKTELESQQLHAEMEKLEEIRVDAAAASFRELGESLESAGGAMKGVSIAAAGTLAAIGAIGITTMNSAQELYTLGKQFNMSSEEIQRWNYIAGQNDISQSAMQNALRRTAQELGKLAIGETAKGLELLGITTEEAAGGMAENFDKILERLAELGPGIEQAHIANEIFGSRVGAMLLPMLADGTVAIDELTAEFESMGFMTEDVINQFDAFEDHLGRLKYSLTMAKNEIGIALLPVMERMADMFEEKVLPAIRRV